MTNDVEYPDSVITTPGSPEVTAKGLAADGYQLAISAFTWGYALVRMERQMRNYINVPDPKPATSYRAPLNEIGWQRALSTADDRDMPTPSGDTLYLSAVVHLTEPYLLTVPKMQGRYYVVDLFNMWQELEHYVGTRVTGTDAGTFALCPPGWSGTLPDGVTRYDLKTDKVWLWGRIQVFQGEDLGPVHQLQDQFTLTSLSGGAATGGSLPDLPPMPTENADDFFRQLAFCLQSNPVSQEDEALFGQFARMGLTKAGYDPATVATDLHKGVERGFSDAPSVCVSNFASMAAVRNGWFWVTGLDDFGYNYPLRSYIAGPYMGGQGEREAMYPVRYTDADGQTLTGGHRYVLRFTSEPPVNAFWSLTVYDAQTKALVASPLDHYQIGPNVQAFTKREDGSFEIPVQREKPTGDFASNWLPTPEGGFYFILRLFNPTEDVLNDTYQLPQVERLT